MHAVLCPKCRMAWEYNPMPDGPKVLAIRCSCGECFEPGQVFTLPTVEDTMPRIPMAPGLDAVTPEPNLMRALDTLKRRKEDQPLPTESTSPHIADLVVEDLKARKLVGISRYGRALQAHNGRDAMRDAYEEALDLCNYLRQMIYERDGK